MPAETCRSVLIHRLRSQASRFRRARLEDDFPAKLHVSRGRRGSYPSESRIIDASIGVVVIHMVKQVVGFPSELKVLSLRNRETLVDSRIQLKSSRPLDRTDAGITKRVQR